MLKEIDLDGNEFIDLDEFIQVRIDKWIINFDLFNCLLIYQILDDD